MSGLYDYRFNEEDYTMTTMIGLGVLTVLLGFGFRSAISERNKYQAQRDALLNLLDSEGRGQEALTIVKAYR